MLRVLQHYFPVRTFLLVATELCLLGAVMAVGMTQHLWKLLGDPATTHAGARSAADALARQSLSAADGLQKCIIAAIALTLVSLLCLGLNRLYEFQISASRYERASRFVESAGAGVVLCLILAAVSRVASPTGILSFPGLTLTQTIQHLAVTVAVGFGVLYISRFAFHWLVRRADLDVRVLILGSRGPAHALANQIIEHPEAGFVVVGLVPEPESTIGRRRMEPGPDLVTAQEEAASETTHRLVLNQVTLLGRQIENTGAAMRSGNGEPEVAQGEESLLELLEKLSVEMVVVALEDRRMTLPIKDLLEAKLAGIEVREREEIYEQVTGRIAVAAMRPSYLIFNEGFRRHPWAALLKRVTDLILSIIMLVLLWPVMLFTAIAVRMTSPGPVLFTQERVGQDGKPFILMKFRSMRADAEKLSGPVWASEDDPRITSWGKVMRKTRLDELPQLFNVLAGSMSIVGPRPERQHFVDQLAARIPYFQLRHIVKPGVTGWAQINYPYGNTEQDALHKLQYDLFYIKNYSVLFDLSILISTVKTVVLRRGT
ncbi:UDP-N-acetylgalactosamine-undecaprenyl-phosphate N-acetylgalactosaminephosphotransferase [Planctomycetes bacterium Poly30]|uniref:UDP-N-acetylgalactosamine-undecaprenyl-phosphate N-acetylgalactosaminephosphotransferase n=1 Tax=Saltatorellus ferox TaxID=2528018 RepID=A0A518ERH8_9BACT|nr:UDP-N-acetylgalactosamine-undecaprenyl-phosphate N-acetylgalactosaminephosphotransferase [Planctomycetes bacterium Poly30]